MTVSIFPAHVRYRCSCGEGVCMFCGGGLFSCVRCGGAEGSLPTDCPGERMSPEVQDAVYAGNVDYRFGRGWVLGRNEAMGGPVRRFGGRRV